MSLKFWIILALVFAGGVAVAVTFSPLEVVEAARSHNALIMMHYWLFAVIGAVAYAVAFAFTVPVTGVLAIAFGFLFGFWTAFILIVIASVVGALTLFLAVRSAQHSWCTVMLGRGAEVALQEVRIHPVSYLLSTRFAPLVPFPLAHIVPAEGGVKVWDFVWTTLVGVIPFALAFSMLGSGFRAVVEGTSSTAWLISIVLAVLSAAVLIGVVVRRFLLRRNGQS